MDIFTLTRQQIIDWKNINKEQIEENKERLAECANTDDEGWDFYMTENKKLYGQNECLNMILSGSAVSDGQKDKKPTSN